MPLSFEVRAEEEVGPVVPHQAGSDVPSTGRAQSVTHRLKIRVALIVVDLGDLSNGIFADLVLAVVQC